MEASSTSDSCDVFVKVEEEFIDIKTEDEVNEIKSEDWGNVKSEDSLEGIDEDSEDGFHDRSKRKCKKEKREKIIRDKRAERKEEDIYQAENGSMSSSGHNCGNMNPQRFYPNSNNRDLRLHDVLSAAERGSLFTENTTSSIIIPILPPENATGDVSDEDSADEDGSGMVNNLPGSMLSAETALDISTDEEEPEPVQKRRKKQSQVERKWMKRDINSNISNWLSGEDPQIQVLRSRNLTPSQYFELFFDEDLIDIISLETNRYALQENVTLNVVKDEIKCFLGVLMLSGYHSVSRRRMYWENACDTNLPIVYNAMRRDRFEAIFTHLHFVNNTTLPADDKFTKVRPLINHLNNKFIQFAPVEEFYSFGESMCEYFGKHGCKQFIQGKPIRFGFKFWCGTTTLGYLVWCEPYQGKSRQTEENVSFGLGGDLVIKFAEILMRKNPQAYHLCFDNFFTSLKLMTKLKEKSIKATGTIRDNRTEKCPLDKKKVMNKKDRGTFDYRTDTNNEIVICRWNDNSVVNICSNAVGIEPLGQAIRYSSVSKKRVQVQQPHLVRIYNEHMGGVDKMDQNMSKYRISIRGKKWYSCIISYMIDASLNNAWQLHKNCSGKDVMDLLTFRRCVARSYLEKFGNPPHQGRKGRPQQRMVEGRYDRNSHWVILQDRQTRCAQCHMKTTTRCEKCNIGVHVKCFKTYHTE